MEKKQTKSKYSGKKLECEPKKKSKYSSKPAEKEPTAKSKYSGKNAEKVKDKIKKKAGEKKKKKDDRNVKLQEKKQIRVQQKNEKKLVSEMVEVVKEMYPFFTANDYFRKYFNLNQFLKLEMFSEFEQVKEEYKGENDVFLPVITTFLKKIYNIVNPRMTESEFVASELKRHGDRFNDFLLLYVKG